MRFQVKLWLEAARDIVLSPITLGAAAIDFLLARQQPPRYSARCCNSGGAARTGSIVAMVDKCVKGENVDARLHQIERVVSRSRSGQRRARIERWRNATCAARRVRDRPKRHHRRARRGDDSAPTATATALTSRRGLRQSTIPSRLRSSLRRNSSMMRR